MLPLLLIFKQLLFQVVIFTVMLNDLYTPYQTIVFIMPRFHFCLPFHNFCISSKPISLYCLPTIHLKDNQECSIFKHFERFLTDH